MNACTEHLTKHNRYCQWLHVQSTLQDMTGANDCMYWAPYRTWRVLSMIACTEHLTEHIVTSPVNDCMYWAPYRTWRVLSMIACTEHLTEHIVTSPVNDCMYWAPYRTWRVLSMIVCAELLIRNISHNSKNAICLMCVYIIISIQVGLFLHLYHW